jgi:hypothetical protein
MPEQTLVLFRVSARMSKRTWVSWLPAFKWQDFAENRRPRTRLWILRPIFRTCCPQPAELESELVQKGKTVVNRLLPIIHE